MDEVYKRTIALCVKPQSIHDIMAHLTISRLKAYDLVGVWVSKGYLIKVKPKGREVFYILNEDKVIL